MVFYKTLNLWITKQYALFIRHRSTEQNKQPLVEKKRKKNGGGDPEMLNLFS